MRKMTPMILVALMLASFFAGLDFVELEEQVVIDEAGARAGADAEVIAITTPSETSCTLSGCRDELKVGQTTTFEAFIKNSGDSDVTEMSYSVTVYLSDANGNPGMVAKDTNGYDLSWTNGDAICDNGCDFPSLGAGAILSGGKYTLQYQGADIEWTPIQGEYVVEISVDSYDDTDPGNDVQQIYVKVVDWFDIEVDLAWDSGNTVEVGEGEKAFTLTVTADGSSTFDPRDVIVSLKVSGDVTTAQDTGGNDLIGVTSLTAGTATSVETWQNGTDPTDTLTDNRNVLTYQVAWTFQGSVVPSTSDTDAQYSVEAFLINYTDYGAFQSCIETIVEDDGENGSTSTDVYHMCEEQFNKDESGANNADEITGALNNFHDIRINRLTVFQGYNSDASGEATSSLSDGEDGVLNVGTSRIHVTVEHRGSSATTLYNWTVKFTTTHVESGTTQTSDVNECTSGVEPSYAYGALGQDPMDPMSSLTGFACDIIDLGLGDYTFKAELTLLGKDADQRPSNNVKEMTFEVANNMPSITSYDLITEGDLVINQEAPLQLSAQAFDVDDPSGETLTYAWTSGDDAIHGCGGTGVLFATCSFQVLEEYVGEFPIRITVTDEHGGTATEQMFVEIWNDQVGAQTTASGMTLAYAMVYDLSDAFTLTAVDGDLADYEGVELPGYSGTYDAVGVIDYTPSFDLQANQVLSQSIEVTFNNDPMPNSLWYVSGSQWQELSTDMVAVNATVGSFSYDVPANTPSLPAGSFVLMGGALQQAEVPDASITQFSASPGQGGALYLNWDYSGTMLDTDSIDITICEAEENCASPFEVSLGSGNKTYPYSGVNTQHGETYYVTVDICNQQGCSDPGASGTVVADAGVDGGVSAMNMQIADNGDNWDISWDATGDQDDVDSWNVCYQRGESFDAANMPDNCVETDSTSVSIQMPTVTGTHIYHFTAVPVDALGNTNAAGSVADHTYHRDADDGPIGNGTVGTDTPAAGVPTWTWGLIGGVVVVAFVVGAFILSRGDEGDEGKDWDY